MPVGAQVDGALFAGGGSRENPKLFFFPLSSSVTRFLDEPVARGGDPEGRSVARGDLEGGSVALSSGHTAHSQSLLNVLLPPISSFFAGPLRSSQ